MCLYFKLYNNIQAISLDNLILKEFLPIKSKMLSNTIAMLIAYIRLFIFAINNIRIMVHKINTLILDILEYLFLSIKSILFSLAGIGAYLHIKKVEINAIPMASHPKCS